MKNIWFEDVINLIRSGQIEKITFDRDTLKMYTDSIKEDMRKEYAIDAKDGQIINTVDKEGMTHHFILNEMKEINGEKLIMGHDGFEDCYSSHQLLKEAQPGCDCLWCRQNRTHIGISEDYICPKCKKPLIVTCIHPLQVCCTECLEFVNVNDIEFVKKE